MGVNWNHEHVLIIRSADLQVEHGGVAATVEMVGERQEEVLVAGRRYQTAASGVVTTDAQTVLHDVYIVDSYHHLNHRPKAQMQGQAVARSLDAGPNLYTVFARHAGLHSRKHDLVNSILPRRLAALL